MMFGRQIEKVKYVCGAKERIFLLKQYLVFKSCVPRNSFPQTYFEKRALIDANIQMFFPYTSSTTV